MTKEEFEKEYSLASGITLEEYHEYFMTVPCDCKEEGCKGWACITKR